MSDLNTLFNKTDKTCSNVFLIDETLCLLNSLKVINSNVSNLSSAMNAIQNTANYLNSVYTLFASSSASWLKANNNIKNNSQKWNNDYSLVSNLSSTWDNEFVLYYTTMFEIQDWNTNGTTYSNNDILNWLNVNFPTSDFANGQIISLYVNLYENFSFDMTKFSVSYYHNCRVPARSFTIQCQPCTLPSRGCNQKLGKGRSSCFNAYTRCKNSVTGGQTSASCVGTGASTINLPSGGGVYSTSLIDRFSVKTVRIRYQKNGGSLTWTRI
jgi:hypothetical protein